MISVDRSTTIAARPDAVWAVLADFGAIASWADNADHSSLTTDQTEGVGTERRIQAGRVTLIETVDAWEPPTDAQPGRLSYAIVGLPKLLGAVSNGWRLEAAGDDRTAVTLTTTIDSRDRFPRHQIAKLASKRLASASDTMLAGLTARVETPSTGEAP